MHESTIQVMIMPEMMIVKMRTRSVTPEDDSKK